MLTQERYKYIMEQLHTNQSVKVNELAKVLNVSVDTVRRDLKHLESKRLLIRSHGGAVLDDMNYENKSIPDRMKMMTSSKVNLGKAIIDEIKDGDVLFLDGSTTTILLVPLLKPIKNLTIITNSLYTGLQVLEHKVDARLQVLGGQVLDPIGTVIGIEALTSLSNYQIDKAILSCYAIENSGFYDLIGDEAMFKRQVISISNLTYFLMDSSKLNVKAPMLISEMSEKMVLVLEEDAIHIKKGRKILMS